MSSNNAKKTPEKEPLDGSKILLVIAIIVLIVAAAMITIALSSKEDTDTDMHYYPTGDPVGPIDCMPPLTEEEAARCKEAEENGWPVVY